MFFSELRHALRVLATSPGFTMVAALSLALGIGVNSAIFSLADAALLRPLPVRNPATLVAVTAEGTDDLKNSFSRGNLSYPNYRDLRGQSRSFDGLIAHQESLFSFGQSRQAVREVRLGLLVSDNFFRVLGIQANLGRTFAADEGTVLGRDAVVVLSYDFWKSRGGMVRFSIRSSGSTA